MSPLDIIKAMRDQGGSYTDAIILAHAECATYQYEFPELIDITELDPRSDYHYVISYLIDQHAQYLYYKHMGISRIHYHYMWRQCDVSVTRAWRVIANADAEDPIQQDKE